MKSPEGNITGPFAPSEEVLKKVSDYEKKNGSLSEQERKSMIDILTDEEFDKKHLPKIKRDHFDKEDARARAEFTAWKEERTAGEEGEARQKIIDND